jgi:hypothetical protein
VEGVANIAVVRHGDATWKLSELLNEREDVFAGAARVYPAGDFSAIEGAHGR